MRAGIGFDAHEFVSERPLILGGVSIPYSLGLAGHSDADVVIHAVIDALLGAAAMGDIGVHFPDSDDRFKDISSLELLKTTARLIMERGYRIQNIDVTVILEKPKIAAYRKAMIGGMAGALFIDPGRISVKATTTEKLGFTGRSEGVAAQAIALLDDIVKEPG